MSAGSITQLIDARQRVRAIDRALNRMIAERELLVTKCNELDPTQIYFHRLLEPVPDVLPYSLHRSDGE